MTDIHYIKELLLQVMSLKANTSQCTKYTELLTVFTTHLGKDLNLARVRLICLFITALCKVKSVNYSKLSAGFDSPSAASSCFRRIQRFMAQADLPMRLISTLIFNTLQIESPVVWVMDRTNWKFGQQNINILMLGISVNYVTCQLLKRWPMEQDWFLILVSFNKPQQALQYYKQYLEKLFMLTMIAYLWCYKVLEAIFIHRLDLLK